MVLPSPSPLDSGLRRNDDMRFADYRNGLGVLIVSDQLLVDLGKYSRCPKHERKKALVSRYYTCAGQWLLIPAGLELEQLGVLPAGGYQL